MVTLPQHIIEQILPFAVADISSLCSSLLEAGQDVQSEGFNVLFQPPYNVCKLWNSLYWSLHMWSEATLVVDWHTACVFSRKLPRQREALDRVSSLPYQAVEVNLAGLQNNVRRFEAADWYFKRIKRQIQKGVIHQRKAKMLQALSARRNLARWQLRRMSEAYDMVLTHVADGVTRPAELSIEEGDWEDLKFESASDSDSTVSDTERVGSRMPLEAPRGFRRRSTFVASPSNMSNEVTTNTVEESRREVRRDIRGKSYRNYLMEAYPSKAVRTLLQTNSIYLKTLNLSVSAVGIVPVLQKNGVSDSFTFPNLTHLEVLDPIITEWLVCPRITSFKIWPLQQLPAKSLSAAALRWFLYNARETIESIELSCQVDFDTLDTLSERLSAVPAFQLRILDIERKRFNHEKEQNDTNDAAGYFAKLVSLTCSIQSLRLITSVWNMTPITNLTSLHISSWLCTMQRCRTRWSEDVGEEDMGLRAVHTQCLTNTIASSWLQLDRLRVRACASIQLLHKPTWRAGLGIISMMNQVPRYHTTYLASMGTKFTPVRDVSVEVIKISECSSRDDHTSHTFCGSGNDHPLWAASHSYSGCRLINQLGTNLTQWMD